MIDISGDGKENVDAALLVEARDAAWARAIEVNGLAMVSEQTPDIEAYYGQEVVTSFVLPVNKQEDFFGALKRKLFHEIARR